MRAAGLREAFEDTRGVIAAFVWTGVGEHDCPAGVRDAIGKLDRALLMALRSDARAGETVDAAEEVERCARDLLLQADVCGERTSVLLVDIRNVLGGHFAFT